MVSALTVAPSRWLDLARRRAARARVRHTDVTREEVWRQAGGLCGVCGKPCDPNDWHVDHVLPLSKGGPHELHNLAPAHPHCNLRKGARVVRIPDGPERTGIILAMLARRRLACLPGPRRIPAAFGPLSAGPFTVTVRLAPAPSRVRAALAEADEIRAAIRDPHARVYLSGRWLVIETIRPDPVTVTTDGLVPRGARLPIARGADMIAHAIDLDATPHVLVAGNTGSGKSEALATLAWAAAKAGHQLVLCDATSKAWLDMTDLDALLFGVPPTNADVSATLEAVSAMMFARDPRDPGGRVVVIVDEAGLLEPRGLRALEAIVTNGRKHHVHAIIADQKPSAERLTRLIIDNCIARIGLRVGDHWTSKGALGLVGAERLLGKGDALLIQSGVARRVRIALTTPADWQGIPRRGTPMPPVSGPTYAPPNKAAPTDDAAILEAARAHGVTSGNGVFKLARHLRLGMTGQGIGRGRANRLAAELANRVTG